MDPHKHQQLREALSAWYNTGDEKAATQAVALLLPALKAELRDNRRFTEADKEELINSVLAAMLNRGTRPLQDADRPELLAQTALKNKVIDEVRARQALKRSALFEAEPL